MNPVTAAVDPAYTIFAYVLYLAASMTLTVWVASTLHANGRVFLVEAFQGDESLADSVNHLLVVGFYLVNLGYVSLALRFGSKPVDVQTTIEFFSTKIGLVLLVLGAMHFYNLRTFSRMRTRRGHVPDAGSAPSTSRLAGRS
jgi:hypothetical protein